jgi:hypothetical protein
VFVLPLVAALVGAVFSLHVLRQYRSRRKPYQAAWAAALALFAAAAFFETAGIARGWQPLVYRGYYYFGVINVGWLAVGTVYLLAPRRVGNAAALIMGVVSLGALATVLLASVDQGLLVRSLVPPRGVIGNPAPLVALIINLPGALVLVGGAAYSAWRALQRQAPVGRVLGLAMIAVGAFIVAGGHSYAQLQGSAYFVLPVAEAAGIATMFAGYLTIEGRRWALGRARAA